MAFESQETRLARRVFIKAAGLGFGAALAWRMSRMALAQPARPRRLALVYIPHGAPFEHMLSTESDAPYALRGVGVGIFEPLAPYQSLTSVLRGLQIHGARNHIAIRNVFTDGGEVSLDVAVARALSGRALQLGALSQRATGFDSDAFLLRDGEWTAPEYHPVRAYDRLFAAPVAEPEPALRDAAFRAQVLAFNAGEVDAMARELRGLTREESKLSRHLAALTRLRDEAERVATSAPPVDAGRPVLPEIEALRDQPESYFLRHENFAEVTAAQVELAGHALLAGATRVVSLQNLYTNANVPFSHLGIDAAHHDPTSHSLDAAGRAQFAQCQRWFMGNVARLAEILDVPDPEDPDHTALENSALFVMSEIADGNGHDSARSAITIDGRLAEQVIPAVLVGGGSGELRAGRLIDFDNRAHGDVLLTLARVMGTGMTSFGANGRAPVQELLT